eukprot:1393646-Amorphochlora_amoeboformis.AAC.1
MRAKEREREQKSPTIDNIFSPLFIQCKRSRRRYLGLDLGLALILLRVRVQDSVSWFKLGRIGGSQ